MSQLTQHPASHQDVKECLCIAAVVKLGARGIEELCDRFQISASLIQALYDTFLKLSRVKSLLFICGKTTTQTLIQKWKQSVEQQGWGSVDPGISTHLFSSFWNAGLLALAFAAFDYS